MQAVAFPRDVASPALHLQSQSRIELTAAEPGRFDLRIDGRVIFRGMHPEFALWVAAKTAILRAHIVERRFASGMAS